jgi:hypothetical protein
MPYKDAAQRRTANRESMRRKRAQAPDQKAPDKAAAGTGRKSDVAGWETDLSQVGRRAGRDHAHAISGEGYAFTSHWTRPRWWGYEYAGCQCVGPRWWEATGCPYRGEEKRWVFYCLGLILDYRQPIPAGDLGYDQRSTEAQGRAAEARGVEIAAILYHAPPDVRAVAIWLRGAPDTDAPRGMEDAPERVAAAIDWLKAMGLYGPNKYPLPEGHWASAFAIGSPMGRLRVRRVWHGPSPANRIQ